MNTIKVKELVIGEGVPKICVPIVAKTKEEILSVAKEVLNTKADIVEWRADWYTDVNDIDKVKEVIDEIVKVLDKIPLIFTIRTSNEGGESSIATEDYLSLLKEIAKTGKADLIDIEILRGDDIVKEFVEFAHKYNVKVIGSNHDFEKTPTSEELISTLRKMQDLGVDMPKIAVMPKNKLDVLALLEATVTMAEKYANRPIITMSMGNLGAISRVCGEFSGSALTFGALGKGSAPGQIGVDDLSDILELLNKNTKN